METFCLGELLKTEETKISLPKEKEKSSSRENWKERQGRKKEKKKEEKT
jgi:hypothetical protein